MAKNPMPGCPKMIDLTARVKINSSLTVSSKSDPWSFAPGTLSFLLGHKSRRRGSRLYKTWNRTPGKHRDDIPE
jgi:hypothetical protein